MIRLLLSCIILANIATTVVSFHSNPPPISPATGLQNNIYNWKEGQQIRYQVSGPKDGEPILLVHGLFVNSDHWRNTLTEIGGDDLNKYRVYAIDLWGCGYSSKPPRDAPQAQAVNGENRFRRNDGVLKNMVLGTAAGGDKKRMTDIDLLHPINSPYNFFTWSELITDFVQTIILEENCGADEDDTVTLVCNSIGTISALQAVLDMPDLYKGVFVVSPNFRELHSAEVAMPTLSMPLIRQIQSLLRNKGQPLFEALAKPDTVKQILMEPYVVQKAVDDTLVKVLLDPLLTPGASDVVFDTLSYSAGPLPEQQLSQFPKDKPVWVCYGKQDPWTPGSRVEALKQFSPCVEYVEGFDGVGHCPHDEAPELVHPLLLQFLERVNQNKKETVETSSVESREEELLQKVTSSIRAAEEQFNDDEKEDQDGEEVVFHPGQINVNGAEPPKEEEEESQKDGFFHPGQM